LLSLLAGQAFGFAIIQNGNSKVFDPQTGDFLPGVIEQAASFGTAGSMKVPHALSFGLAAAGLIGAYAVATLGVQRSWSRRSAS